VTGELFESIQRKSDNPWTRRGPEWRRGRRIVKQVVEVLRFRKYRILAGVSGESGHERGPVRGEGVERAEGGSQGEDADALLRPDLQENPHYLRFHALLLAQMRVQPVQKDHRENLRLLVRAEPVRESVRWQWCCARARTGVK
jgi:hypothetical protein